VAGRLQDLLPRVRQMITPATRRVLQGEHVPAAGKLVSLFEPHTAIIPRHKAGEPIDLGRKVWPGEPDGGLIRDCQVLDGAPRPAAAPGHRAPRLGHGDGTAGDGRCGWHRVALLQTGLSTAASRERAAWYRWRYRLRAGIEGCISVLKGSYRLSRCAYHGAAGLERWVGWGALTANLVAIARATAAP
jgi:IS5 family transposase